MYMYYISLQKLEVNLGFLVGDCLVAAAFLSYAGPFLSGYRDELVQQTWLKQVYIHVHVHVHVHVYQFIRNTLLTCV